jgi:tRNA dimethylallyltransferase
MSSTPATRPHGTPASAPGVRLEDDVKNALVVCGPTAAGKSELADALADAISERMGHPVPTVAVDSMQVYVGLERISNQARRRPAELVGVVPVTERWTMARHRDATEAIVGASGGHCVLDAGTGMYLNAILLGTPLAPPVPAEIRARAQREAAGAPNPRRASRERELAMVGVEERGSIWDGEPRYRTRLLYLRPERSALDKRVALRSKKIAEEGLEEAAVLKRMVEAGEDVNPSVLESVGVRELMDVLSGRLSPAQAEERLAARTRRLARKQLRWFDKLARTLEGRASVTVAESPAEAMTLHTMHDTMGA